MILKKHKIFNLVIAYWKVVCAVLLSVLLNILFILLVKDARADFLKKSSDLNMLFAKRTKLSQLQRQFEDISETRKKIDQSFVNKDNLVDFIIILENTARNTGNKINIKSVSDDDKNKTKIFQIEIMGNYSELVNFIAQVESLENPVSTSRIEVREFVDSETKTEMLKTILEIKVLSS